MLSMIGAALGVLMFIWGFLKWLEFGGEKYGGYAFGMPTTAVIGLSLAAGLMALLGALERRSGRGVPSAIPTALAGSSLLVALGILLGKGTISPDAGGDVGAEVGLILGLITAILQTIALGMGLASRGDDAANTAAPFGDGQPGYAPPQPGYGTPPQPGYGTPPQPGYGGPPQQPGQVPPAGSTGYPPSP